MGSWPEVPVSSVELLALNTAKGDPVTDRITARLKAFAVISDDAPVRVAKHPLVTFHHTPTRAS